MPSLLLLLACSGAPSESTPADDSSPPDSPSDDSSVSTDDSQADPLPTLVINELLSDNEGSRPLEDGSLDDWLELHNIGDAPVDLGGLSMSDDWTDKDRSPLPNGQIIEPGGYAVFVADGLPELGPDHLDFRLAADGERVGLFTTDERTVDWIVFPELPADQAYARIPDGSETWEAVVYGTPGAANARLGFEEHRAVELGSTWRYWDRAREPETEWTQAGFDDSEWLEGVAPLGYGDAHIATTIRYGSDPANKRITAWFRLQFTLEDGRAPAQATLEIMADDGAIVYLNGVEVARYRMPSGEVSADTPASATASGDGETTPASLGIDRSLFVEGVNQVAVEVHQVNATSSDMGMDLGLSLLRLVEIEG